jgi:hypothetical protein
VGAEDLHAEPDGATLGGAVDQLEDAPVAEPQAVVQREAPPPGLQPLDLAAAGEPHIPGPATPRQSRRCRGRREERCQ